MVIFPGDHSSMGSDWHNDSIDKLAYENENKVSF